ncbi:MAG TPA: hypothetical protein PLY87_09250 [Planctomycetaceae bacterium]|nr:hypothetical protein [Planctomycetaceae bacterium]
MTHLLHVSKDKRSYCEGGRFEGQRGNGTAFDKDGKAFRKFKGTGG